MVKKIFKAIIFEIFSKKEQIATARTNSHGQAQVATACGGPLAGTYAAKVPPQELHKIAVHVRAVLRPMLFITTDKITEERTRSTVT
jgi:hypothetical protein